MSAFGHEEDANISGRELSWDANFFDFFLWIFDKLKHCVIMNECGRLGHTPNRRRVIVKNS